MEIDFPDGARIIKMENKDMPLIRDCEEGKVVSFFLYNNQIITGYFAGMDGEDMVKIRSISGKHTLGYQLSWIENYLEETKP